MAAKYHGRKGRPWRRLRASILEQSDLCHICGLPGADSVDHVLPLSEFPQLAHDRSNLAPAHRACNSRKGRKVGVIELRKSRQW